MTEPDTATGPETSATGPESTTTSSRRSVKVGGQDLGIIQLFVATLLCLAFAGFSFGVMAGCFVVGYRLVLERPSTSVAAIVIAVLIVTVGALSVLLRSRQS